MGLFGCVRAILSLCICCALLAWQCAPALAGTTGGVSGVVTDAATGRPLADAKVSVTSPSQTATVQTDSGGHFAFLSLEPDTYTLTALQTNYDSSTITGIAVFADQTQTVTVALQPSLKTIARVTSRSSISPVKPGTTGDVYSVNPALAQASATLGGGGNLTTAYSAIAAMPGAYVPPNQVGVDQSVYIRGGYYDQIGFEFDGVPVNRSFDNLPSHAVATLGQQELQIYTGGGPAAADATGLAGFVNQVIKTGTYPGSATIEARVGGPSFYHEFSGELSGATPDHRFSYYVALSGTNQFFNYLSNNNGTDMLDTFPYGDGPSNLTTFLPFYPAVYPNCNPSDPNLYENPVAPGSPANTGSGPTLTSDPGCYSAITDAYALPSMVDDRETVANLHFAVPHRHDSGRDDIQLLFDNSTQYEQIYAGPNDVGQPLLQALETCCGGGLIYAPHWPDFLTYPAGTPFFAPANTPPIAYLFPGSPLDRCNNTDLLSNDNLVSPPSIAGQCANGGLSLLPNDYRDGRWDQASIFKAQYQKNFGSNAYLRLFGYTFYSNTNRSGASRYGIGSGLGGTNYDYEVDAHTRGAEMQFADQLTGTNQLMATLNYTTASTLRSYSYQDENNWNAPVSNLTNGSQCFAAYNGYLQNDPQGLNPISAGSAEPCNDPITQGTFGDPTSVADPSASTPVAEALNCSASSSGAPIPSPACAAGASWRLTYTGNNALINAVTPKFTNFSLTDEWRPNEKLDINASIRLDRDEFDLRPIASPGTNFWFAAAQNEFCYYPDTLLPLVVPQPPQNASSVEPYVALTCPGNTVHPDGKNGHVLFTDQFNPTYVQSYAEPRFGLTYQTDPDTVLRFSAGRYAQEPQNYEVEYDGTQENLAAGLFGFLPFGFTTPRHDAGAQFSNNFDLSYEHHIRGTDLSFKLTPFYRYATDQLYETVSIPTLFGLSPSFNSGTERADGVELEFTAGDFNKNGFSGVFSYTFTNAKEQWANYAGVPINPVDPYNEAIQYYNQSDVRLRRLQPLTRALRRHERRGAPGAVLHQQRNRLARSHLRTHVDSQPLLQHAGAAAARQERLVHAGARFSVRFAEHVLAGNELPPRSFCDNARS